MDQKLSSLIIKVSTIPSLGMPRWPIGRGTVTLGQDSITLHYTSATFFKITRVIAYSDIDSYY